MDYVKTVRKDEIMKKLKRILLTLIIILLVGCTKADKEKKINIISTNFPGYDFARAITKNDEDVNVRMLVKPGTDIHHYEITLKEIINIQKSDMFIYNGGDSDEWVKNILKKIDPKNTKIIKIMDLTDLKLKETENEKEYDEHVWTSPVKSIEIIEKLKEEIIDIKNNELYTKNTNEYINELKKIDNSIKEIVSNSKRKEIIFADRFPLKYFTDEYKLKYYAAFPGCSEQTEASSKTVSFLIDKVRKDKVPVIFHLELSNKKLAKEISKETGTKILEFNSAHNIANEDFKKGITYVDIMKKNIKVIKEALN